MKYRIAVCDDEKVFANDIIEKIKSDNPIDDAIKFIDFYQKVQIKMMII